MLKMADNRVKRERKIPKTVIEEFVEAKPKNLRKIKTTDRNIYPVVITQVDNCKRETSLIFIRRV